MSEVILIVLLVVTVANSSVLAYLLFKARSSHNAAVAPELLKSVGTRLIKLESFAASTSRDLAKSQERVQVFEKAPKTVEQPDTRLSRVDERLHMVLEVLEQHRAQLAKLDSVQSAPIRSAPPTSALTLEREILREAWKRFRENRKLAEAMESAVRDPGWQDILLSKIPQSVPGDLKLALDAILGPVQDSFNLVTKLFLVPRLVDGDLPKLESEAQEGARLREFGTLLIMTQSSRLADCLNFRLGDWIEHHFLGFTDQFLQRYQQAQLEGATEPLESCHQLIRQVLGMAGLEPIGLTLGSTRFDDHVHLELSAAHYPNLPDGVIIAVVRNGFVRGGQEILRQAEVIVNRIGLPGEQL